MLTAGIHLQLLLLLLQDLQQYLKDLLLLLLLLQDLRHPCCLAFRALRRLLLVLVIVVQLSLQGRLL